MSAIQISHHHKTIDALPSYEYCLLNTEDGTGFLRGKRFLDQDIFQIDWIKVTAPRQGIGKSLITFAKAAAIDHGSSLIKASIISPECLASMTDVFGADYIDIRQQSEFGRPGTHAILAYPLISMAVSPDTIVTIS